MASVLRPDFSVNMTGSDAGSAAAGDTNLDPVVWHALAVAARGAAQRRDQLHPGQYAVDAVVRVRGALQVGHDLDGVAGVTPDPAHLVALVLAKLNTATRAKILAELPDEFAAHGNQLPAVDAQLLADTAGLLQALRRKAPQRRRGAVTGELSLETLVDPTSGPPALALVG
jgi:hypothetical protein